MSFVKQLTREQVKEFIRKQLIEADFHPELPSNGCKIDLLAKFEGENAVELFYCSKLFNRHIPVYLMDDRMRPLLGKEIEEAWIKYLYSIFGEEYKNWYMSEKEKLFE